MVSDATSQLEGSRYEIQLEIGSPPANPCDPKYEDVSKDNGQVLYLSNLVAEKSIFWSLLSCNHAINL